MSNYLFDPRIVPIINTLFGQTEHPERVSARCPFFSPGDHLVGISFRKARITCGVIKASNNVLENILLVSTVVDRS